MYVVAEKYVWQDMSGVYYIFEKQYIQYEPDQSLFSLLAGAYQRLHAQQT